MNILFRKLNLMSKKHESRVELSRAQFEVFIQGVLSFKAPSHQRGMSSEDALNTWRRHKLSGDQSHWMNLQTLTEEPLEPMDTSRQRPSLPLSTANALTLCANQLPKPTTPARSPTTCSMSQRTTRRPTLSSRWATCRPSMTSSSRRGRPSRTRWLIALGWGLWADRVCVVGQVVELSQKVSILAMQLDQRNDLLREMHLLHMLYVPDARAPDPALARHPAEDIVSGSCEAAALEQALDRERAELQSCMDWARQGLRQADVDKNVLKQDVSELKGRIVNDDHDKKELCHDLEEVQSARWQATDSIDDLLQQVPSARRFPMGCRLTV